MTTQIKHTEERPLVAIHCMVYNHAPFLRECFEGFVMQKTTFPFIAIVHDDASTDESADILREYEAKYPHIFKPIYQTVNQHSIPGVSVVQTINKAIQETGAKYIAMCEGDDYWTDPLKLQKQIDFLEANPEYSFCCHRFKILKEAEKKFIHEYGHNLYNQGQNLDINEDVFFKVWVTQWLTTMVRTDDFIKACDIAMNTFNKCLDVYIYTLLLQIGKGISLNQEMGIYRWHSNGASKGRTDYQCVLDGYNVYSKLYYLFPSNSSLYAKTRHYALRLLGYCCCIKKNDRQFYKASLDLLNSTKEKIQAFFIFYAPPFFWQFLRHIYSYWRFHK